MKKIFKLAMIFSLLAALTVPGACSSARYELTTSVEPAGAGTVSPGGTYDEGSNVRIKATPAENYAFDGWSGDVSGSSSEQTITMNSDKTVTAHFKMTEPEPETVDEALSESEPEPVYYTLTARAEPANAGSVTPSAGKFMEGTTVTLVAIPQLGYSVSKWGGDISGISSSVAVTMDSDKEITVYFEVIQGTDTIKQFTLTTSVYPENSGAVDPSGGKYNTNAKLTVTAMPADGYEFHHWSGGISGTSETVSFNIIDDTSITAVFEESGDLTLSSPVFTDEGNLPELYSCNGEDISPELSWSGVPANTASFVLIMDDPDAPQGTFTHWVIYNIPPDARALHENIPKEENLSDGSIQGINNFAEHGYGGPCPPTGQRHEYRFVLYAVDIVLDLSPYAATKSSVLAGIQGHILEQTRISGYYQR